MQASVDRGVLVKLLERVAAVTPRKSTAFSQALLSVAGGELLVRGGDADLQLFLRAKAEGRDGACCVEPSSLLAMVRALDGDVVDLALAAGALKVSCGRTRYSLPASPGEMYPAVDTAGQGEPFDIEADALATALERVDFAIGDESRFGLNGIHLEVGEHWNFVATDGHRLACSQPLAVGSRPITKGLVPLKAALALRRLGDGDPLTLVASAKAWAVTQAGDTIWFRWIDGEFPDWRAIVPQEDQKHLVIIDRKRAIEVCKRVKVIVGNRQKAVRFRFDEAGSQVEITASDANGEVAESLPATITGGSLKVGFNVAYFLDALEYLEGDAAYLTMAHQLAPAKITTEITDGAIHVIMPMRLD